AGGRPRGGRGRPRASEPAPPAGPNRKKCKTTTRRRLPSSISYRIPFIRTSSPHAGLHPFPHAAEVSALPVRAAAIRAPLELVVQQGNLRGKPIAHLVFARRRQ